MSTLRFSFYWKFQKYCVLYINIYYIRQLWFFLTLSFSIGSRNVGLFDNVLLVCYRPRSKSQVSMEVFIYVFYSTLNFFNIILVYAYASCPWKWACQRPYLQVTDLLTSACSFQKERMLSLSFTIFICCYS